MKSRFGLIMFAAVAVAIAMLVTSFAMVAAHESAGWQIGTTGQINCSGPGSATITLLDEDGWHEVIWHDGSAAWYRCADCSFVIDVANRFVLADEFVR